MGTEEEPKEDRPSKGDDVSLTDAQTVTMTPEEAEQAFNEEEGELEEPDETEDGLESTKPNGSKCKLSGECTSGLCEKQICKEWEIAGINDGEGEGEISIGIGSIGGGISKTGGDAGNTGTWW